MYSESQKLSRTTPRSANQLGQVELSLVGGGTTQLWENDQEVILNILASKSQSSVCPEAQPVCRGAGLKT